MAVTKKPAPKTATKANAADTPKVAKPSIQMDAPASAVQKFITSIATRGARLDHDMHSAAMACLYHADKHGDITLMNRLILAVPKATRRNALALWATSFGKFVPNEDKATRDQSPLAYLKDGKTNLEGASAKPFWEFRGVREGGAEWMYLDYITGVMKKLASVAGDPKNPEHAKAKAALDALSAVNEAMQQAPAAVGGDGTTGWTPGVDADRRTSPETTAPTAH